MSEYGGTQKKSKAATLRNEAITEARRLQRVATATTPSKYTIARLVAARYGRSARAIRVANPTMATATPNSRQAAAGRRCVRSGSASSAAVSSVGGSSAGRATLPL